MAVLLLMFLALNIFAFIDLSLSQSCDLTTHFKCPNQHCYPKKAKCDYTNDCGDNSDESDGCSYPKADKTKALLCILNNRDSSKLMRLYGDPDDYVRHLNNDSYTGLLPINIHGMSTASHAFMKMAVSYTKQSVIYGGVHGQLTVGPFVYVNSTGYLNYAAIPFTAQIRAVAFDWRAFNVYWIDGDDRFIGVIQYYPFDNVNKKIVVANLTDPKSIALHPDAALLFWIDGAVIEKSNLAGNNRRVLVTSSAGGLVSPTNLAVDYTAQKLYWLDSAANVTGSVNFDGSNITISTQQLFGLYASMTIHGDYLFFGNGQTVYMYNKNDLKLLSYYTFSSIAVPSDYVIKDIDMFSAETQPDGTGPCSVNNGDCSQLCFAMSTTRRSCDCSTGFTLASDGTSCLNRPFAEDTKFLLVADYSLRNIYALRPDTGEVRALIADNIIPCTPRAVSFDIYNGVLYWTCTRANSYQQLIYRIRRMGLNGKIPITELHAADTHEWQWRDIAVDSNSQLLYYTDSFQGLISEMRTDGSKRRVVYSNVRSGPHTIVIDSANSRLYWTDCTLTATSINAINVDGSGFTTLVTGTDGSCIAAVSIDFDNNVMYWATNDNPRIDAMSLGKNKTNGTLLLAESSAARYTGIALLDGYLYISDAKRRNLIKFNVTSKEVSVQPPSVFTDIVDVEYFHLDTPPTSPPTPPELLCEFRLTNMKFIAELRNSSSPPYINLYQKLYPILVKVLNTSLAEVFQELLVIEFRNGSVVVESTSQLSSTPSNDALNNATKQLGSELESNNFTVSDFMFTVFIPPTSSRPTDVTTRSIILLRQADNNNDWKLIVGIVVGVGGFLLLVVIVVVIVVCVYFKKAIHKKTGQLDLLKERQEEPPSRTNAAYCEVETYDELETYNEPPPDYYNKIEDEQQTVAEPAPAASYELLRRGKNYENRDVPEPPSDRYIVLKLSCFGDEMNTCGGRESGDGSEKIEENEERYINNKGLAKLAGDGAEDQGDYLHIGRNSRYVNYQDAVGQQQEEGGPKQQQNPQMEDDYLDIIGPKRVQSQEGVEQDIKVGEEGERQQSDGQTEIDVEDSGDYLHISNSTGDVTVQSPEIQEHEKKQEKMEMDAESEEVKTNGEETRKQQQQNEEQMKGDDDADYLQPAQFTTNENGLENQEKQYFAKEQKETNDGWLKRNVDEEENVKDNDNDIKVAKQPIEHDYQNANHSLV